MRVARIDARVWLPLFEGVLRKYMSCRLGHQATPRGDDQVEEEDEEILDSGVIANTLLLARLMRQAHGAAVDSSRQERSFIVVLRKMVVMCSNRLAGWVAGQQGNSGQPQQLRQQQRQQMERDTGRLLLACSQSCMHAIGFLCSSAATFKSTFKSASKTTTATP
jgi:hypothetical protein